MTVAEPGKSSIEARRVAVPRRVVGRLARPVFLGVAIAALVAVAGAGGYLVRDSEARQLDRQLSALTVALGENNQIVETTTARTAELSEENLRLTTELDGSNDLAADLSARLASVEAAVQSTTDLESGLEALVAERDQLRTDLVEVTRAFQVQSDRLGELKSIESFGPNGNPLLFDKQTDAWVTQPVCTGSMEPAIGCEDLLVVYRPTATDLDVGDIIIFRRPAANCEGFVSGSSILHRITRVVSSPTEGLMFETKGDANGSVDPCRAPVSSVTGKVLAIVQNSRLPG